MSVGSGWSNWQSGSFRVRPHRPLRNTLLLLAAIGALAYGGWWLYHKGLEDGGYKARMARATEAHLRLDIEELRERIEKLTRRKTLLERTDLIDRDAIRQLRGEIEKRERRIDTLEEELAFYRNLVSPSDTGPGLHVRRLTLAPVPGDGRRFRYEMVLTQLNGDGRYVKGRVDLVLQGGGGEDRSLEAEKFLVDGESNTSFRFKYFQTLDGVIRLPDAFEPAQLRMKVVPAGGRLDPVEAEFSWDTLIAEGA